MKKTKEVDLNLLKETIDSLDNDKKIVCTSLLNELLFMKSTLAGLKEQVEKNGVITKMCQGKYDIDRTNPALNQYNILVKNYASCIKQLNDLLPSDIPTNDDFENDDLQ